MTYEHDGCEGCRHQGKGVEEIPCISCKGTEIPYTDTYENATDFYEPVDDVINHPKHYNREGAMECFDEMILVFGEVKVAHYCLLNAWKYRYRSGDKNGSEDMKKSDWYMKKYKELKEKIHEGIAISF